jgi:hypothetical protein
MRASAGSCLRTRRQSRRRTKARESPPGKGYNYFSLCTDLLRPWPDTPERRLGERGRTMRNEPSIAAAPVWALPLGNRAWRLRPWCSARGDSLDGPAREPGFHAARLFRHSTSCVSSHSKPDFWPAHSVSSRFFSTPGDAPAVVGLSAGFDENGGAPLTQSKHALQTSSSRSCRAAAQARRAKARSRRSSNPR